MAFDAHKNFAYSTVLTAPSTATAGTSLVVQSGNGTKFPAVPFNATVWPAGAQPTTANSEIVRVTTISTDTFTITRGATSGGGLNGEPNNQNRAILVGDQIAAGITARTLTDIESGGLLTSSAFANASVGPNALATGAVTATVTTSESTTSTSYAALTTAGPSVTATIGANGLAFVTVSSYQYNSGANNTFHGFAVSGANTLAASNINSVTVFGTNAIGASLTVLLTGLTAGSTTFTSQYEVGGTTGTFSNRMINVVPL